jgi:hypothetical protein
VSRREECLDIARKIIVGDREEQYSGPEDSFTQIARYWEVYLERKVGQVIDLGPDDVAVMMCLLKLARLSTGGTAQPDTWIDAAGYAACGYEVSLHE